MTAKRTTNRRVTAGLSRRWPPRGIRVAVAMAIVLGLWLVSAPTGVGASSPVGAAATLSPAPSAVASPAASPGIIETGDPRSNGQGPGLVGSPVEILIGVVLLGAAAAGGTLLYVRLTRER